MSLSIWVTRTELSLADLQLNVLPYKVGVEDWDPGEQIMRRLTVASPMVHGEVLVHAVRGQRHGNLDIRVAGATPAARETNRTALFNAFSQYSYELHRDIDGVEQAWLCDPADWTLGDTFRQHQFYLQPVRFSVPCYPIPVTP